MSWVRKSSATPGCANCSFFAKRADFPRFKRKSQSDSFRYPQGCKLDQSNSRIFLPKLGWLRYRNSRDVLSVVKNATVSQFCGKWYVSIQTVRERKREGGEDVKGPCGHYPHSVSPKNYAMIQHDGRYCWLWASIFSVCF